MCEQLYVSYTTLSQCLKEVKNQIKKYNLILDTKPRKGIKLVGSEFDLRQCLSDFSDCHKDENIYSLNNLDKNTVLKKIYEVLRQHFINYNYQMSDVSFNNLVMHIYIALYRLNQGEIAILPAKQKQQIIQWEEYPLALSIVKSLETIFNLEINQDEIGYIAIHLASKKTLNYNDNTKNIVINNEIYDIVSKMLDQIFNTYQIDFRNDLELRMMLALHLVPFGIRMAYDLVLHNPLLKDIKTQYAMAYNLAVSASSYLKEYYHSDISDDEIGYFALHFNLALERRNQALNKKNILIVCSTGRGSAQLLLYQFKDNFGKYLNQIYTCDILNISNFNFDDIDYVITTVPIDFQIPVPILEIKSFINEEEVKNIKTFLNINRNFKIDKYFKPELFFTNISATNKSEVLNAMLTNINNYYSINISEFYQAILKREELATTEFNNLVAIPHPFKPLTNDTFVSVCILPKPIKWSNKLVQLIFLMSMEKNANRDLVLFYKITSKLLVNTNYIQDIITHKSFDYLLSILQQIEQQLGV